MSEFIAVSSGGSEYAQITDHNFTKILPGDIESVRERLVHALEQLDYRVISEQPLIVKPRRQPSSCSFDVLKCVKSLTIGLKSVNPTSTLVTFDYEILNSFVSKGDRKTVEREAEAIIALATAQPPSHCVSCGAHNADDSRFCRVCGRLNVASQPTEMEVLRLTAGARPAYQQIVGGFISALGVLALALPLIFWSSKGPQKGIILLIVGEILAFCWMLYGLWRLHHTLNPKGEAKQLSTANVQSKSPAFLPPQTARASVTEGTTELLVTPERDRVAVPARSKKVDTAEMS